MAPLRHKEVKHEKHHHERHGGKGGGKLVNFTDAGLHSGFDIHHMKVSLGHKHHKRAGGSYFKYTQDQAYHLTGQTGSSVFADMFAIGTLTQRYTTTGTGYGAYQSDSSYLSLNPYQKITGSAIFPAGTYASQDELFLKKGSVHIDLTSGSSVGQFCKLRVFKSKRDQGSTPIGAWSTTASSMALGQPLMVQATSGTVAKVGYQGPSSVSNITYAEGGVNGMAQALGVVGVSALGTFGFDKLYEEVGHYNFTLDAAASKKLYVILILIC